MQNPKQVLSCDWGTSSFRLRLIDIDSGKCLHEVVSDKGNAVLFNMWKAQSATDRLQFYLAYLKESIDTLAASSGSILDGLCLLISGMASSSIGMKELPYADLPFTLDGRSAYYEWIIAEPLLSNPLLLISGVQIPGDVMRGEETQLAGVSALLDVVGDGEMLYLFPGTHSKHITVSDNSIIHFDTFMTGELFDLLIKHSILSHAVTIPDDTLITEEKTDSFRAGVMKALESELLNNLFSVRIHQLKKQLSNHLNYFYLSGLLIGSEIKYIRKEKKQKLVLCSSGNLQRLYQAALTYADLSDQTIVVTSEILDNAAAAGQLKIFKNIGIKIS
jgi:2-dehydro-3-deoxygalactonokinase